jgi:hypothetical protein
VATAPDLDWRRPSARLWHARRLEVAVPGLVLTVAGGVTVGLLADVAAGVAVAAVVAGVAGVVAVLLHRRYLSWGYAERDDDLLIRRGLLLRRVTVVPYGRMQFVDVSAGPVDRAFGIATVQLHTAAAATDARIPGVESAEAQRLRDQLAALGEAKAAGL